MDNSVFPDSGKFGAEAITENVTDHKLKHEAGNGGEASDNLQAATVEDKRKAAGKDDLSNNSTAASPLNAEKDHHEDLEDILAKLRTPTADLGEDNAGSSLETLLYPKARSLSGLPESQTFSKTDIDDMDQVFKSSDKDLEKSGVLGDTGVPFWPSYKDYETTPLPPEKPKFVIGMEDTVKALYEGPAKCQCCINWLEEYPDNLKESLLGTEEVQKHAILAKNIRNHKSDTPMALESIVIQSPLLKKVLEKVFEGYSGITAGLEHQSFSTPFKPFFHRLEQLEQASKEEEDPKARLHTKLLYDLVSKELQESVDLFNDYTLHRVITFEYLWALFKPELVKSEKDRLYLLESAEYTGSGQNRLFTVSVKFIDWDGERFGYASNVIDIHPFTGTKSITELAVYPAMFDTTLDQLKEQLIRRGKRFETLRSFHYMSYKGLISEVAGGDWLFGSSTRNIDGRIIVDAEMFFRFNPHEAVPLASLDKTEEADDHDLPGTRTRIDKTHLDYDYDYHVPVDTFRSPRIDVRDQYVDRSLVKKVEQAIRPLTDEELILCSPKVRGYSLTTKKWALFEIDNVRDIKWNENAFDSLVLPSNYKQLILSFVEGQINQQDDFDDVIEGKGQGIIMLLAGVPGVGKTLTAESVAEELHAPLYSMTAGELGLSATSVESALHNILEVCTKWNAVLLLDEADVFLEQRTSQDLERNKLVSIFLRMLEYYRGILFLTTNRLSSFDAAFQSRIHITINYPALSSEARSQIWRTFLRVPPTAAEKDSSSKPKNEIGTEATDGEVSTTLLTSFSDDDISELAGLDLNGRQIKNIVKTSRLLARRLNKGLSIEEVRTVLEAAIVGTYSNGGSA